MLSERFEEVSGLVRDLTTVLEKRNARITELEADLALLQNLLAVVHGDGGHYVGQHGLTKATADAQTKWIERSLDLAAIGEEVAAWRRQGIWYGGINGDKLIDDRNIIAATDARPGCRAAIEKAGEKQ